MERITISLIGTHGVGKTAHLYILRRELEKRGLRCKLVELGGGYFRFLSFPVLLLFRLAGRERKVIGRLKGGGEKRVIHLRHPEFGRNRNTYLKVLWCILFLLDTCILNILKKSLSKTEVILCDRCIYDSIFELMIQLNDHTIHRRRIGKFFMSLTRPDMALLLDTEIEVIWQRRSTWSSLEDLRSSRALYRKMASDLRIPVIDTNRPFKVVHKNIVDYVEKRLNFKWSATLGQEDKIINRLLLELLTHEDVRRKIELLCLIKNCASGWINVLGIAKRNRVLARVLKQIYAFENESSWCQDNIANKELAILESRTRVATGLLLDSQTALKDANVKFVIFKTLEDYPDFAQDIDILVASKDLIQAERAICRLKPLQYRKGWMNLRFLKILTEPYGKSHFLFGPDKLSLEVELYTKLTNFGEQYLSESNILKRSVVKTLDHQAVRVPSPEDSLLIEIVHTMYKHGGLIKLSNIVNAIHMIKRSEVDWIYFLLSCSQNGITAGAAYFLAFVNYWYNRLFGETLLPQTIMKLFHSKLKTPDFSDVVRFPYRIPLRLLLWIYLSKFCFDLHIRRWRDALVTLKATYWRMTGSLLHRLFLATNMPQVIRKMGWG